MRVTTERVREIFSEAVARAREAQRAYLDDACAGDASLRGEVERLLVEHLSVHPMGGGASRAPTLASEPVASEPRIDSRESRESRYRTLGQLGVGGCGVVVQRFDRSLRRVVASKSLLVATVEHEMALLREARLLAYLDHPGVVQVYDLCEDEAGVSYTMELLEGESLFQRLAELRSNGRQMAIAEAVRIVSRVCEAVANAHERGVVHLDIKPANVMLRRFGQVLLIDWGMARFHDPEPYRRHLAYVTESAHALLDDLQRDELAGGTPAYMPPEQFDPNATLGPAADIYAIGVLLFELLAGRLPFDESDMVRLWLHKRSGTPSLRELRPEVSERLSAICARLLAPSPDDRPASLGLVLEDLASLTDAGGGTEIVRLETGEILFEQGAESTTAYQILSGELEILVGDDVVATRSVGDIVGELAMLAKARRTATVRAGSSTVVRAIDWAALEHELSKIDPLVGHLLRNLSSKLIETTRG